MNSRVSFLCLLAFFAASYEVQAQKSVESSFISAISGINDSVPPGYVPPLISNGSISMLVDYQGNQVQKTYVGMIPGIYWAGRRYGSPDNQLIPFGYFGQELAINGRSISSPSTWSQTLDKKGAVLTCRNDYENKVIVETIIFVPLSHDIIVVKKRILPLSSDVRSVRMAFNYQFTPPGIENSVPKRTISRCIWNEKSESVDFYYQVDGLREYEGIISVFSDKPVTADIDKQAISLSNEIDFTSGKAYEITYYLLFADSMDGKDFMERSSNLQSYARNTGFEELLAFNRKQWEDYWEESYLHLPDTQLEKVYNTAQYHLRANATRWSFPVGIFPTHWQGKYFGWDEMFCFQALASSNHLTISKRVSEFHFSGLSKAMKRISHYSNPGLYGARFPWESLEDGSEGTPPGFWLDHVFHMSNIALSCWLQFLYTQDLLYLKLTGYPVIKECARFYISHMLYENPDGTMFIGKCTDLERLGPAKQNPYMTACGAIYTLEVAALAAESLNEDGMEAARWTQVAGKLRESLPYEDEKYIPFKGCTEKSVAALGGLFPYPIFDADNKLQRNAVYDFVNSGRASGNMYPVGTSVCAWYAGWMASALALLGDRIEPVKLLSEAAGGAGCFAELFEINEPKVSMHPWFSTASGNFVYALNQMLLQCKKDKILIAPAVPDDWKDFSYKLPCYGDIIIEVIVKNGRIIRLIFSPGDPSVDMKRTLIIPETYLEKNAVNKKIKSSTIIKDGYCHIDISFKGETLIIN